MDGPASSCLALMKQSHGISPGENWRHYPNMYNQNKDLIHSHFCRNSFPSELNQILRMPMQASDTTFHTMIQQHLTIDKQHVTKLTDS